MPANPVTEARPLPPNLLVGHANAGCLLGNIIAFAGLLRHAGLCAGIDREAAAAAALARLGVESREDVRSALAAVFVDKREQLGIFLQAFELYWRGRRIPVASNDEPPSKSEGRPLSAALDQATAGVAGTTELPELLHGAGLDETLADKDFEQMSRAEWQAAVQAIGQLRGLLPPAHSRRRIPAARGKPDLRRTIRRAMRHGGDAPELLRACHGSQDPTLVVLVDISGSMSAYSRAFLHFLAALSVDGYRQVRAFLLGTRLTPIPRARSNGVEAEAERIASCAMDWNGGTRLTSTLREFNRNWLRRVPNAHMVLATDGLERDCADKALTREVERLSKSCRRLWWLNPLLRYEGYAPLARGAAILAKHANEVHSIHSVRSLAGLMVALAQRP